MTMGNGSEVIPLSITNKMQRYTVFFIAVNASGSSKQASKQA
jgi:hypothetical protein